MEIEEREQLATLYRPHTFQQILGQDAVKLVLYQMVRNNRVPRAALFHGPHGSGKTTTARILGAAINCQRWDRAADRPVIPCRQCDTCAAVEEGASLGVLEVDAASNGSVAEIRKLREMTWYSSPSEYRVVLLDEAHSMSGDAFNALLKVLEEPPERTVFVLVTTEPGRIMRTVRSRCRKFPFRRIPTSIIVGRLRAIRDAEGLDAEDALLALIADRSDGALRDAINELDQLTSVGAGIATAEHYTRLFGEPDFAPQIVGAMASGNHAAVFAALDAVLETYGDYAAISAGLVHCLRDVLVLGAGGEVAVVGEGLAARQRLAQKLTSQQVVGAMRVFWDLRTKARGADPRSSLELAAVLAADKFAPQPARGMSYATGGNSNGHAAVTADELAELAASV